VLLHSNCRARVRFRRTWPASVADTNCTRQNSTQVQIKFDSYPERELMCLIVRTPKCGNRMGEGKRHRLQVWDTDLVLKSHVQLWVFTWWNCTEMPASKYCQGLPSANPDGAEALTTPKIATKTKRRIVILIAFLPYVACCHWKVDSGIPQSRVLCERFAYLDTSSD
jgi:hypothetical protein